MCELFNLFGGQCWRGFDHEAAADRGPFERIADLRARPGEFGALAVGYARAQPSLDDEFTIVCQLSSWLRPTIHRIDKKHGSNHCHLRLIEITTNVGNSVLGDIVYRDAKSCRSGDDRVISV